jgi:hypothetical protein
MLIRRIRNSAEPPGLVCSEAVLRHFVAVAARVEEDLPVHQARLVESDQAVAVGPVGDFVDGFEFDQGHAAPGAVVDHADRVVGTRRLGGRRGIAEGSGGEQPNRAERRRKCSRKLRAMRATGILPAHSCRTGKTPAAHAPIP